MSDLEKLNAALKAGAPMVVCYTKCWSCQFGEHEHAWHTWADADDIAHAKATGQADPSEQRCGCHCQRGAVPPDLAAPEQELADDYLRNDHR